MHTTKELVKHIKAYKRASGMRADAVIEKLVETLVEDGQGETILGLFNIEDLAEATATPASGVVVRNYPGFMSSHKQCSLDSSLNAKDIQKILGPDVKDTGRSGDGKCTHQWFFTVDGVQAAIWDYKGVRWSGYGPQKVFDKLGIRTF